jgi:hypothetical protein
MIMLQLYKVFHRANIIAKRQITARLNAGQYAFHFELLLFV